MKNLGLKKGYSLSSDGDLYHDDGEGKVTCYPKSGGAFIHELPGRRDYVWIQIAGTCDLPYRVALSRAKEAA